MSNHFDKYRHVQSRLVSGELSAVDSPLVTIAIPTFRRGQFLREAIASALRQEPVDFPFDVIVVDNESDGDMAGETGSIVRQFNDPRLLYYRNEQNIGMFGNWNRFFELARGEWVVMLHDDDILSPFYLKTIHPGIVEPEDADIIHFPFLFFSEQGDRPVFRDLSGIFPKKTIHIESQSYLWGNISSGVVGGLFKRKAFLASGGFDEDYYPSSDYEYWARASQKYKLIRYPEIILGGYRKAVNESLNPSTLFGWLRQDTRIKLQLAEAVPSPWRRWLMKQLVLGGIPDYWRIRQQDTCDTHTSWRKACRDNNISVGVLARLLFLLYSRIYYKLRTINYFNTEKAP